MRKGVLALVILATAWVAPAWADGEDPMRRVSFRVESERQVSNDWIVVSLAVTDEDADPAALADRINQTMGWALEKARGEKRVKVRSGGYSTHPVYEQSRIRRWRASQQLWIEGSDFDAATKLLGTLQSRLQLQSLSFSVSPERRREVEDELIAEALAAFQARAKRVAGKLGASGYEIAQLGIETPGGSHPPIPFARDMAMESAVAQPAVEGGTSRLAVQVHATIELE